MAEQSLWHYFSEAGVIVKLVMMLLFLASIASWTMIIHCWRVLKTTRAGIETFEDEFWSGVELTTLYSEISDKQSGLTVLQRMFAAGFSEFLTVAKRGLQSGLKMQTSVRAMKVVQAREMDQLAFYLPFLATIGSVSPYVGLFGTVWGIMTSFQALGAVSQATISMVAPGISEALVATAMGLFAAIPAVIAYNRFSDVVERISLQLENFQEELNNILSHQLEQGSASHA